MSASGLTLVVGSKNKSSWSLRPWLTLRMAGLDFDEVVIPLDQPESRDLLAQHSPSLLVPVLKYEGRIIWDSLAIIEYAHDLAPDAGIWPKDRGTRAVARSYAAEMHAGFYRLRKTMPMDFSGDQTPFTPEEGAAKDIARITALWREALDAKPSGGPFLFGAFCAADAMFAPVVSRFRSYGIALDETCQAYADAVWALNPMQEWLAASIPEREREGF